MSVGTLISFKQPEREDTYLPLATEVEYHSLWVSLAKKNQLNWLIDFGTGCSVPLEFLPEVIAEFHQLTSLVDPADYEPEVKQKMKHRIQLTTELLEQLDPETIEDIFIG